MEIAVENLDGRIYRVLTSTGMGAYIHATSALLDLGFEDLLRDSLDGKDGYDSWFVPTQAMLDGQTTTQLTTANSTASRLLTDIEELQSLPVTERDSLALSRIGQGEFRAQLVSYWKGCAVTGAECIPLLRASHIKPWRTSSNTERLDVFNGLLLAPNIDAAFDSGYVTFDPMGKIVLSQAITGASAFQLHINAKLRINRKLLRPEHESYLEHHRAEVFLG